MGVKSLYCWFASAFAILVISAGFQYSLYAHEGSRYAEIHQISTRHALYEKCRNDLEGYAEKVSGQDILYHSFRPELQEALICRATDGSMSFAFRTQPVPRAKLHSNGQVTFFFYANIGLLLREPFDVSVNGNPLLTFYAGEDGRLHIPDNPGNGNAEFLLLERDHVGDGLGAFRLTVPAVLLKAGEMARIRVAGQARQSNAWVMFFKSKNVIPWLKKAAMNEAAFHIRSVGHKLVIDAPAHFAGREVRLTCDGQESGVATFKHDGEMAKAALKAKAPVNHIQVWYDGEMVEFRFDRAKGVTSIAEIQGDFFFNAHIHHTKSWSASLARLYRPQYYPAFQPFLQRQYKDGMISMMNSSHQDIAWVDRPEACIIMRDTLLLTPILEDAFERPDYGFDIEDGLILHEYLERHPEAGAKFSALLKKKLISVGATFNCPYEDMYDGEDLARQFYLGKKWVKEHFDGYDAKVYWNVDVPGKTLQMPQLLKKAGVDHMVISRHAKGLFHWQSPDGSTVFTYSPGHYGNDVSSLSGDIGTKLKYGAQQFAWWKNFYPDKEIAAPLLSSADMLPAIDYTDFISSWNALDSLEDREKNRLPLFLPHMELMTMDEFMPLARNRAIHADTIRGERPNVWVYIHGPAHHKAISASRNASKLLTSAEKFASIAWLLDREAMPYPSAAFDAAWFAKIYPDHGWGGHDGDITDNLFRENLERSEVMGRKLVEQSISFIARRVSTGSIQGFPVIIFNSLSWNRTDAVTFPISLPRGYARQITLYNQKEEVIPVQLRDATFYPDGSIRSAECVFIAPEVPAIGYATYQLKPAAKPATAINDQITPDSYENDFYRVSFVPGGIGQVYDKQLERPLFDTRTFKAGEVFTMQSPGNGAGEFGDIQQPDMEGFDRVSEHGPKWNIIDDGPVYTTYQLSQQLAHVLVEMDVTLYHALKHIRLDYRLLKWDGTMYREFRTAFPVAIEHAGVSYDVPFGQVRVGKDEIHSAGERYTSLCKDVRPRAVMDWISASNEELEITVSSPVAAADWIDPAGLYGKTMLQHVLLASRTSCHWEGNDYAQHGNHTYACVLTSHAKGDPSGIQAAEQFQEPLYAVFNPDQSAKADLPLSRSFFSIDKDHLVISTIKKAGDSENLVMRLFDNRGTGGEADLETMFPVQGIFHTNLIEENPEPVSQIRIPPHGIETFLISVHENEN